MLVPSILVPITAFVKTQYSFISYDWLCTGMVLLVLAAACALEKEVRAGFNWAKLRL